VAFIDRTPFHVLRARFSSFDQSKFNASFLRKGQLSFSPAGPARDSCISRIQAAWKPPPPQNSTVGLLMCLSPQVPPLMWRDWFLNGCFSSQRNTYFQSLIGKLCQLTFISGVRQVESLQQMRSCIMSYLYFSFLIF